MECFEGVRDIMGVYDEWKPITDFALILERLDVATNDDLFVFVKAALARLETKIDDALKLYGELEK